LARVILPPPPVRALLRRFRSALAPEAATFQALKTCAVVPDQELREMRGRFATYFFGLDVGLNLAGPSPAITVNYTANVPSGSGAPSFTGNTASFNSGNVNFQAGIGPP
jgi:hypothetical protein